MKAEQLKERIEKLSKKIDAKKNTIVKKEALIVKKTNKILNGTDEARWIECEIEMLEDDLKRLPKEIAEMEKTLAKYNEQLEKELNIEDVYVKEVPEVMKELEKFYFEKWLEYDLNRIAFLKKEYKELGYRNFVNNYAGEYQFMLSSVEELERNNKKLARNLVLNLYNRTKEITGEVESWENIHLENGNEGICLNGFVKGKMGTAKVESILAGGYNIQKLHIRVLVNEVK